MAGNRWHLGDSGVPNFNNMARGATGYIHAISLDTGTAGLVDASKIENVEKLLHGIEFDVVREDEPPARFRINGDPDLLVSHLLTAKLCARAREHEDRHRQGTLAGYLFEKVSDDVEDGGDDE